MINCQVLNRLFFFFYLYRTKSLWAVHRNTSTFRTDRQEKGCFETIAQYAILIMKYYTIDMFFDSRKGSHSDEQKMSLKTQS